MGRAACLPSLRLCQQDRHQGASAWAITVAAPVDKNSRYAQKPSLSAHTCPCTSGSMPCTWWSPPARGFPLCNWPRKSGCSRRPLGFSYSGSGKPVARTWPRCKAWLRWMSSTAVARSTTSMTTERVAAVAVGLPANSLPWA